MNNNIYKNVANNLKAIHTRINHAVEKYDRQKNAVTLVAVSKFHPATAVLEACNAGQAVFGESYVQEALKKQQELTALKQENWHLIGHIQKNKVKEIVGRFSLIHSIDSFELAEKIDKEISKKQLMQQQNILVQVNIGNEEQKSGVSLKNIEEVAEKILQLSNINFVGLMGIPPFGNGTVAQPFFRLLRETKEKLEARFRVCLPHLSMGMSGDLESAIAEGATFIRVGTDIFGPRSY